MSETRFFVVSLCVFVAGLAVSAGYCLTLHWALGRCARQNRTMSPGLVWLELVPLLGIVWWFVNVGALAESLENEYRSHGARLQRPYQSLGRTAGWLSVGMLGLWVLAYGVLAVATGAEAGGTDASGDIRLAVLLAVVICLMGLAFLALWAMYWVKIIEVARRIETLAPAKTAAPRPLALGTVRMVPEAGPVAGHSVDFCHKCGLPSPTGQFCPRCGAQQRLGTQQHLGAG